MKPKSFVFAKLNIVPLRAEASDKSEMVSQLLFGETAEVLSFNSPWIEIRSLIDNYTGFADHKQFSTLSLKEVNRWHDQREILENDFLKIENDNKQLLISKGAFIGKSDMTYQFSIGNLSYQYPSSEFIVYDSPVDFALSYRGTPYLWGGKNAFGIDCSALVQIAFRLFNINLPRDAWQQAEGGLEIDFEDQEMNDLAFFTNDSGKIIHVGIIDQNFHIIHAAGEVRVDKLTKEGIIHSESGDLTHKLFSIKRY